jgi:hypothetical protein
MTLQPILYEFPYIREEYRFLFINVHMQIMESVRRVESTVRGQSYGWRLPKY